MNRIQQKQTKWHTNPNIRVHYTAVDAVEKKLGGMSGKNVDPQKYRAQNEKLTDKIRGFLEKATGKKVCVCVCVLKRKKSCE